jgi:hypothetical protein
VRLRVIATAVFIGSAHWLAAEETPLPVWQEGERAALEESGWVPGGILLTEEPLEGEAAVEALVMEPPNPEEIAVSPEPPPEIEERYLNAYFERRPERFLVDPQGLLSPKDFSERLGFLDYHASDSTIDLFVYLIGGDQDIPSAVREEEVIERFFGSGRPAMLVYYYLGAPQRSVVYLSPSITDSISSPEQNRALESSVLQALEKTDPAEQFEKFLIQMSIRIYWMERVLSGEPEPASAEPAARSGAAENHRKDSTALDWLREVTSPFVLPGLVLGAILFVAFGFSLWLRRQARYRFPEFEVEPRLGGAHAAGVGAVISFASASLPPASQRDQVPEYLRRA